MAARNVKAAVLEFMHSKGEIPGNSEAEQLAFEYLDNKLIDSLGIIMMIVKFEDEFGIHFEPEDMQAMEFRTIGGLINMMERMIRVKKNV